MKSTFKYFSLLLAFACVIGLHRTYANFASIYSDEKILPEDAVAVVTSISGKAVYVISGKETALTIGLDLEKGAQIKVINGKVSIVFMNGDFIEIEKDETITIGSDAKSSIITSSAGQRGGGDANLTSIGGTTFTPSKEVRRMSQLIQFSTVRGEAKVIAVSPRLILSISPQIFTWFDSDSMSQGLKRRYTLIVHDSNDKKIYRTTVQGKVYELNSFTLPKISKLKTTPGQRYSWAIFQKGKEPKSLKNFDAKFTFADSVTLIHSKDRVHELDLILKAQRININTYNILLGNYFSDARQRLFSDAVPYFHKLAMTNPTQSYPYEQLSVLLTKFGNEVSVVSNHFASRARQLISR